MIGAKTERLLLAMIFDDHVHCIHSIASSSFIYVLEISLPKLFFFQLFMKITKPLSKYPEVNYTITCDLFKNQNGFLKNTLTQTTDGK